MIEVAKKYIGLGLNCLPIKTDKSPAIGEWTSLRHKMIVPNGQFEDAFGIGILCGAISGNLECIDIDTKYDLTGTLYEDYKKLIFEYDKNILEKLVVEQSVSGGYHFIYRCPTIGGNTKLAKRKTTDEEKESTYKKRLAEFQKKGDSDAVKKALREKENDKNRDLIETRGEGGYFAANPTQGYSLVYGSFERINEITPQERQVLFDCAYLFNTYVEEAVYKKPIRQILSQHKSPLDDWNTNGDIVPILTESGWTFIRQNGENMMFRRPGSDHKWSASYHTGLKLFYVFSTSTEFDAEKGYNHTAVLAKIKFNNDFAAAASWCLDNGYGERTEKNTHYTAKATIKEEEIENEFDFVATTDESENYLQSVRSGTYEEGLRVGFPVLDDHFRYKRATLVVVNGIDNVGKTLTIIFLAVVSAVLHKWKWIIWAAENKTGGIHRKIMEFYVGKELPKMTDSEYEKAKRWADENFTVLKKKYNCTYSDLLLMADKLLLKKKYDAMLIDPYNAVLRAKDRSETVHDYDYEVCGHFREWAENNDCCIYLNCHAQTEAARRTHSKGHDKEGQTMPPQKADTEGGQKFANRADDFLTIHRYVSDENDWMWTEIHVRKIKDNESGGRATPINKPFKMKMMFGSYFVDENGFNPLSPQKIIIPHQPLNINHHPNLTPDINIYSPEKEDEPTPF